MKTKKRKERFAIFSIVLVAVILCILLVEVFALPVYADEVTYAVEPVTGGEATIFTIYVLATGALLDSVPEDFLADGIGPVTVAADPAPPGNTTALVFSIESRSAPGTFLTYRMDDILTRLNRTNALAYTLDLSPFGVVHLHNANTSSALPRYIVQGLARYLNGLQLKVVETVVVSEGSSDVADSSISSVPSSDTSIADSSTSVSDSGGDSSDTVSASSSDTQPPAVDPTDSEGDGSRPFLSTKFDDYTVTEGLLLIVVILLAAGGLLAIFRGR